MYKHVMLISLLIYLISCNSSDNSAIHKNRLDHAKPVKTSMSNGLATSLQMEKFSQFLKDLNGHQMIYASEIDLQQQVKSYLPDSTVSEDYDLHIQEIGRIDSFRLVFHEYFDLYDNWSKTYLNIFSPTGKPLFSKRLWELTFEGNTSINFVNNKIIEIAYHDFFKEEDLRTKALIPSQNFYLTSSSKVNNLIEGTIYEYYKIETQGLLKNLSQNTKISKGRYFPQSSAKLLSYTELNQFDLEEIKLMKDEILAEHGYIFQDLSIQNYFEMQNWYNPLSQNVDSLLTDIEQLNFACLSKVEKEY